jgi:hypothetical protein
LKKWPDAYHKTNPHKKDIGKNLLKLILKEAEISKETWEKL